VLRKYFEGLNIKQASKFRKKLFFLKKTSVLCNLLRTIARSFYFEAENKLAERNSVGKRKVN
jgi:hypothetical protein